MPRKHYENFPVGSWLLPRRLRSPVADIYRFARSADDIADEGDASPEQRLADLAGYRAELDRIAAGVTPLTPEFQRLARTMSVWRLPLQPFRDLLSAFAQDVTTTRYAHFGEVVDYCRRSANPVGRLMLALFGDRDPRHESWSDAICTSLQLINFLQDVAIDWHKGRVYLPRDEMLRMGIGEDQIAHSDSGGAWPEFMRFQVARCRRLMRAGAPLGHVLPGRIGLEIRTIVHGGLTILDKIDRVDGDVFQQRPVLGAADWTRMLYRAARRV
jgi:squalene synthase HpnC